jgi:hypothetical protein
VSVSLKNCFVANGNYGICLFLGAPGLGGILSFDDCIIQGAGVYGGLCLWGKSADSYAAKFNNCLWQYCNSAIVFQASKGNILGGVQFTNCTINETDNQAIVKRDATYGQIPGVANITGNVTVNCPYGAQSSFGPGNNVTVQVTEKKLKPPMITSVLPDKGTPYIKVNKYTAGDAINISALAYDPDIGMTSGAGISKVDFALMRSSNAVAAPVASYSDVSAPYAWPITTSAKCPRGIYMIRITAYSNDGSYTVAMVPISIYNTVDGTGPYVTNTGIEFNHETMNFVPEKDFLVRTASQGFMVYSPFARDGRIVISDLSGRQVTLAQTVKGNSWNNIGAPNKLSNNVYFVQTVDGKGNNRIVKKVIIAK